MSGEDDSADNVVTRKFSQTLEERISEGDYDAQWIFNINEMGLYWKKILERTYTSKEEKKNTTLYFIMIKTKVTDKL